MAAMSCLSSCKRRKASARPEIEYSKAERNLIRDGVKQYRDSDYRQAEINFEKALSVNPQNSHARYNAALTQINRTSLAATEARNDSAVARVDSVFASLYHSPAVDTLIRANAEYNRGNMAYNTEKYDRSIEHYKNILRADPSNRDAVENLRLAQLKLQEQQQQQQQNQDNKDNQDQQQQEQEKEQQQQNKDQNKDQEQQDNKQQNQDEKEQNQDQQKQNQNRPRHEDQDKKPQEQQSGMSQSNAQQILDAMEKKEAATRQRYDEMKAAEERRAASRPATNKPW